MTAKKEKTTVGVYLPVAVAKDLADTALSQDRSQSWLGAKIIEKGLQEMRAARLTEETEQAEESAVLSDITEAGLVALEAEAGEERAG